MCRIMVIRSPCVTRPAADRGVGLSALCRRRRPRWEGTLTPDRAGHAERGAGAHGDEVTDAQCG
jgi:hypothetical protein